MSKIENLKLEKIYDEIHRTIDLMIKTNDENEPVIEASVRARITVYVNQTNNIMLVSRNMTIDEYFEDDLPKLPWGWQVFDGVGGNIAEVIRRSVKLADDWFAMADGAVETNNAAVQEAVYHEQR